MKAALPDIRVQHHVHLERVFIREFLIADGAGELLAGAVHGLGVSAQVRRRQVTLVALRALVRTLPLVS